jgi:hypothetical protein
MAPNRLQTRSASMSRMGQNAKCSERANNFRSAPMNRHHQARTPCRKSAKALVWGDWCQGFLLWAISLFGRAATSPRPDLFFARLLGAAAVKGGRRPSRSDLPFTAASTAADLRDRGASFFSSVSATETIPRGSSPSCAQIARHELVFGRSVRIATTMQSCASAAKLREGGPILNRGARTIVQHRVAATSVHQLQLGIDKALGCSNSVVLMRPVAAADLPASRRLSRAATAQ